MTVNLDEDDFSASTTSLSATGTFGITAYSETFDVRFYGQCLPSGYKSHGENITCTLLFLMDIRCMETQ